MRQLSVLLSLVLLATQAWGLNLEPLAQGFAASGRESIRTFRITNTQPQDIAVRVYMTTREISQDGIETRREADTLFTVFPARLLLAPGRSQAVRVQWRGRRQIDRELPFRIVVEQVPVTGSAETGGQSGVSLNFLYRYVGSVYVGPDKTQADIVLSEVREVAGANAVALHFENRGDGHAIVTDARVTLTNRSANGRSVSHVVRTGDLSVIGSANFTAGTRLVERINLPEEMSPANIDVAFEFETTQ
jgi:fimbrial chaperone protein